MKHWIVERAAKAKPYFKNKNSVIIEFFKK